VSKEAEEENADDKVMLGIRPGTPIEYMDPNNLPSPRAETGEGQNRGIFVLPFY
jgi:hypothetical protein